VSDEKTGEAIKVFVVKRGDVALDIDTLIAWCRKAMTPYKVPKFIEFVDQLPKSTVGKVLRRELRG
jgi:long-chain acyl-CoA synthetase